MFKTGHRNSTVGRFCRNYENLTLVIYIVSTIYQNCLVLSGQDLHIFLAPTLWNCLVHSTIYPTPYQENVPQTITLPPPCLTAFTVYMSYTSMPDSWGDGDMVYHKCNGYIKPKCLIYFSHNLSGWFEKISLVFSNDDSVGMFRCLTFRNFADFFNFLPIRITLNKTYIPFSPNDS